MRRRPTCDEIKLVRSKQENVPEAFEIKVRQGAALAIAPDVAACVPRHLQIPARRPSNR